MDEVRQERQRRDTRRCAKISAASSGSKRFAEPKAVVDLPKSCEMLGLAPHAGDVRTNCGVVALRTSMWTPKPDTGRRILL